MKISFHLHVNENRFSRLVFIGRGDHYCALCSKSLQLMREVNAQSSNGIHVIALCVGLEDGSSHFLGIVYFLCIGTKKNLISFTG